MKNKNNSLRHFGLYFLIHLRFYIKFYLWTLIGITISLAIVSYTSANENLDSLKYFLQGSYLTYLYVTGCVFASSAFFIYAKKNIKFHLLTIPFSSLTRFLTAFIFTIPIFWIVFTAYFWTICQIITSLFIALELTKPFTYTLFANDESISTAFIATKFWHILQLQSVLLMAGAFFPKLGFVKAALSIVILYIIIGIIDWFTAKYSFDFNFGTTLFSILNRDKYANLQELLPFTSYLWYTITLIIVPFSWYVAYLRVREMEV